MPGKRNGIAAQRHYADEAHEAGAPATLSIRVTGALCGGVACVAAATATGVALPGLVTYRQPQE